LGFGAVLVIRELRVLPSLRPILVGLGGAAAGGAVLWLLRAVGPVPATLAALVVYSGVLILFRIVTTEDVATAIRWVRQVTPGWSRG
jgi:hypothetical protein